MSGRVVWSLGLSAISEDQQLQRASVVHERDVIRSSPGPKLTAT
jgi:hypothetical protein